MNKRNLLILICCLSLLVTACSAQTSLSTDTSPSSASVSQESREEKITSITERFSAVMETGDKLFPCINEIAAAQEKDKYGLFQKADAYAAEMDDGLSEIDNLCQDMSEFEFMRYQIRLAQNATPSSIPDSDKTSVANQAVYYQLYLNQLSSSFNYLSEEMKSLRENTASSNQVTYYAEVTEMPTPDSIIYDISFISKKQESGVIQYMYSIGADEYSANMNYNNYIAAIDMCSGLSTNIDSNMTTVLKNGTMVSAMMAGTDNSLGYILIVSFPAN